MSQKQVVEQCQTHLKLMYQRALDADKSLDALKSQGHGKFSVVLNRPELFQAKENRFLPYVYEVAEKVSVLEQNFDAKALEQIVASMAVLTELLEQFKAAAKSSSRTAGTSS